MRRNRLLVLAAALLLNTAGSALAEDIELFLEPPSGAVEAPNVLFVLDNSANWDSNAGSYRKKDILHQALAQVALDPTFADAMNVGIMTYTNNSSGGKILAAVKPLSSEHQTALAGQILLPPRWSAGLVLDEEDLVLSSGFNGHIYKITSVGAGQTAGADEPTWPTDGSSVTDANGVTYTDLGELVSVDKNLIDKQIAAITKGSGAPYALSLHESYLYYSGDAPLHGTDDGTYDASAISGGQYVSPSAASCAKNFVIVIGNGSPDSGENNQAESLLTTLGGKLDSDPITLSPDNYESNWADEYARFTAAADVSSKDDNQGIITFVIDVVHPDDIKTNPDRAERAFLKSIAKQGRGRYFQAKSVDEVLAAISAILDEIAAVNSVFASTTLPVSVNVRGTNLNQVYMGVFRPDANALPHWVGNLKLYQLAVDTSTESLYLADKNGNPAESPTTGFIVSSAVSYWTSPSTFWDFNAEYSASDSPDGEIVEKGAAAQNLRDAASRNLFTCTGSCSTNHSLSGTPFAVSNEAITQEALGAADAAERDNIINWMRGVDLFDENNNGATDDIRASVHGDVLHSRPAVINYNRNTPADEDDIIAFYGANDGVFHAVYGGKDGESNDGDEIWGFIPEEFFGKLKTLYDNGPAISAEGGAKPYFADGNIGVYQEHNGDGVIDVSQDPNDKVHLFISMRRGGRMLYALDVSAPENPKLLWKRTSSDTGWGELGQTWSEPKVSSLNIGGTGTPVLIMGAGYDAAAEDADPQGTATMGRGVFVVNAANGNIIWQAGPSGSDTALFEPVTDMTFPIPSNVTIIDRDRDGYDDRVYVGDTGGQLWRLDIGDSDTANWTVTKLASIADHSEALEGSGHRKFLYAPDVVYADGYDAILIGSGDREHPLDTTVANRFYMFKDTLPDASWSPITESDLYDATDNLIQDGDSTQQSDAVAALDSRQGWYIRLEDSGEKVVTSAVTLSGSTFFNTNAPTSADTNSCVAGLGTARNYIVSYKDATATTELDGVAGMTRSDRSNSVVGGGFPPSPVPVIVQIDGKKYQAVVSGTKVLTPPNVQLERRERVYWYRPGID